MGVSTGVGDHLGRPQDAKRILTFVFISMRIYVHLCQCHRKLEVFENMKKTRVENPRTKNCLTAPHSFYGTVLEQKR